MTIKLNQALASGDLESFIRQEEAEGRMVDRAEFERRLGALVKAPRPEGRTSRSRVWGCHVSESVGWFAMNQARLVHRGGAGRKHS